MHAVIVGRKKRGVQINLRQRGFMYFRRTMVMSEEEEEPLPRRRDAAISTNCDMYMFPPSFSILISNRPRRTLLQVARILTFISDFKNKAG